MMTKLTENEQLFLKNWASERQKKIALSKFFIRALLWGSSLVVLLMIILQTNLFPGANTVINSNIHIVIVIFFSFIGIIFFSFFLVQSYEREKKEEKYLQLKAKERQTTS